MTLNEFQQFTGIPYSYINGPDYLEKNGLNITALNCQALVHKIYKDFGIYLPPTMRSKEIFEEVNSFMISLLKLSRIHFG